MAHKECLNCDELFCDWADDKLLWCSGECYRMWMEDTMELSEVEPDKVTLNDSNVQTDA